MCAPGVGRDSLQAKPATPDYGPKAARALLPLFYYPDLFFSDLNLHRTSFILLKYIENGLKLRKIQNKFCWNPIAGYWH
jgi:hypothetical protein